MVRTGLKQSCFRFDLTPQNSRLKSEKRDLNCERSSAVEHALHMGGVTGSIPVVRTIFRVEITEKDLAPLT